MQDIVQNSAASDMLAGKSIMIGRGGVEVIGGGGGVMIGGGGGTMDGNDMMDGAMGTQTGAKDPILSNVPFVAGTISAMLVVGIVLGILFGKKRIKKGFDSYEN